MKAKGMLIIISLFLFIQCHTVDPVTRYKKEHSDKEFSTKYPYSWRSWNKQFDKNQNSKVKGPIKNKW